MFSMISLGTKPVIGGWPDHTPVRRHKIRKRGIGQALWSATSARDFLHIFEDWVEISLLTRFEHI